MTNYKALRRAIESTHAPGNTIAISGRRGGGKTHLAVWLIEYFLSRGWKVFTNILFMRRTGPGEMDFEEAYPDGVIKIKSMAEMYYWAATLLKKNRYQRIAVVRDEAQNYIVAFRSNSTLEVEMFRCEGDYRKFNICSIYITPTFDYIPKSIRTEYVKAHWYKLDNANDRSLFEFEVIGLEPVPVKIGVSKYNKPWSDVKIGEYVYDHMSSAVMTLGTVGGKDFDIAEFRKYYGDCLSPRMPDTILEYFRIKGGIDSLNRNEWDKEDDKRWAFDCFRRGMEPKQLYPYIESVTDRTVRAWYKEYSRLPGNNGGQSEMEVEVERMPTCDV